MRHLAILTALLGSFLWFSYPNISAAPFSYDEADYMVAARQGFTFEVLVFTLEVKSKVVRFDSVSVGSSRQPLNRARAG